MRLVIAVVAGIALLAPGAWAQITNLQTEGNLAATQNPGCVSVTQASGNLSPADLALGMLICVTDKNYDGAVELFILMQLRAAYDAKRVSDKTAHQAGMVLALQINSSLNQEQQEKLQTAFTEFGGTGAPRHTAFCAQMQQTGPPDYHPRYMIQHGLGAFTDAEGDGLVAGFQPKVAWRDLLAGYMKCDGA